MTFRTCVVKGCDLPARGLQCGRKDCARWTRHEAPEPSNSASVGGVERDSNVVDKITVSVRRGGAGENSVAGETSGQLSGASIRHTNADRFDSRWERQYADRLDAMKASGEICDWGHHRLRFRLADGYWHTPDFDVWPNEGPPEVHEVKGHRKEAGMLRFATASVQHPRFVWRMFDKHDGKWREIRRGEEQLTSSMSWAPSLGLDRSTKWRQVHDRGRD